MHEIFDTHAQQPDWHALPKPVGGSAVLDGEILVRGAPIGTFIGSIDYIQMIFLQVLSRYPELHEHTMMQAYLVSLCEHGVTSPSTHGARVAASVRAPFASCAINFISAAMGPFHFGALEQAMIEIQHLQQTQQVVEEFVDQRLTSGIRIWGFGHRFHKSASAAAAESMPIEHFQEHADPRVRRLVQIADALQWSGPHLQLVRSIGRTLFERKKLPINIDGLAAGLLLDMGFQPAAAMLFVTIGRLPNIARLYLEEQEQSPNRFVALATNLDPGFQRTTDRDQ